MFEGFALNPCSLVRKSKSYRAAALSLQGRSILPPCFVVSAQNCYLEYDAAQISTMGLLVPPRQARTPHIIAFANTFHERQAKDIPGTLNTSGGEKRLDVAVGDGFTG